MMKQVLLIAVTAMTLAACGADGLPTRPDTTTPGLSLSGDARFGIAIDS